MHATDAPHPRLLSFLISLAAGAARTLHTAARVLLTATRVLRRAEAVLARAVDALERAADRADAERR